MHAIIFTAAPQWQQTVISMLKTRLSLSAQVIFSWPFGSGSSSALSSLPCFWSFSLAELLPRLAGVTCARSILLGANTPWYRVKFERGFGTKAASFAMKSSGSNKTCVVPFRYGVFSSYWTLPCNVSAKRSSETAGLAIYRHNRSSFLLSRVFDATPACKENPAILPTWLLPKSSSSSHAGIVCKVKTLRPCAQCCWRRWWMPAIKHWQRTVSSRCPVHRLVLNSLKSPREKIQSV